MMPPPLDPTAALRSLLATTGASRVTLRLDVARMNFPVVAEAVVAGVRALSGDHSLDQRRLHTVQFLFRERRVLVQNDCATANPTPPPALLTAYGVQAQMLAPLFVDDKVLGWVSVHECGGPRTWTAADVECLLGTTDLIRRRLCGAPQQNPAFPPPGGDLREGVGQ